MRGRATEGILSIMQVITWPQGNTSTVSGNGLEGWGSDLGSVNERALLVFVESSSLKLSALKCGGSSGLNGNTEGGGCWDDRLSTTGSFSLSALHKEELGSWVSPDSNCG